MRRTSEFERYLRRNFPGISPSAPPPPVGGPTYPEGIGTSWGAWGQPESQAIRQGRYQQPAPTATAFQPGAEFLAGATEPSSTLSGNPWSEAELGKRYVERRAATAPEGPGEPFDPKRIGNAIGNAFADPQGTALDAAAMLLDAMVWGTSPRSGAKERRKRI